MDSWICSCTQRALITSHILFGGRFVKNQMIKCTICMKKSATGTRHRCIVCDNEYDDVAATAKHCLDRGHPGGHHPQGSVLMKARQNRGKGRHSVLKSVQLADEDEDEDKIGLNEDANDLVVIPKDDDITGDEAPPVLSASTSSKRKIGRSDNDDDIDDKDATLAPKARKTAATARVTYVVHHNGSRDNHHQYDITFDEQ
jgi:hypothetical protein